MLAFFLYGTLILCHKCAVFPCAVASSCRPPVLLCACELARHKTLVRCAPPTGADPAMMRGLMIAFCLFGATWRAMTLHLIACYDGKGPCFLRLRGWGSGFFTLQIIDDATGCLLFLVLCRKGMLVGTDALLLQLIWRKPSLTCMREKKYSLGCCPKLPMFGLLSLLWRPT